MTKLQLKSFPRFQIGTVLSIIAVCVAAHGNLRAQTPTPTPPSLARDVTISIALMDPKNVADIFGRRVAQRYVAVQLTIGNKSADFPFLIEDVKVNVNPIYIDTTLKPRKEYFPTSEDKLMVRGVAEKGQIFDPSNFIFRSLKAVGSIAATVTGIASVGPAYAPTLAMFNGPALTSYRDVFPDMTINQMNRLNDNGYSTNTIVGKQSSKVMVAFLPQAILMDSKLRSKFRKDPLSIAQQIDFRNMSASVHGTFMALVEEARISIKSVDIPADEMAKFRGNKPEVKGQLTGKFLDGSELSLDEPANVKLTINGKPEENRIRFTLTADGPIPDGTALSFRVAKNGQEESRVQDVTESVRAPSLTEVNKREVAKGEPVSLILSGSDFVVDADATRILITPDERVDGESAIEVTSKAVKSATSIEIVLKVAEKAPAKEYEIRVITPTGVSNPQKFRVLSASTAANK